MCVCIYLYGVRRDAATQRDAFSEVCHRRGSRGKGSVKACHSVPACHDKMTGKRQGDNLYKYQHIIIIYCASNICLIFMCVYIILHEGSGTLGRSGTLFQSSVIGRSLGEKVR